MKKMDYLFFLNSLGNIAEGVLDDCEPDRGEL